MSYIPVYESRINWENYPSVNTPINEDNLNKLDYAAFEHDKSLAQIFNQSIKRIDFNTTAKKFVITYWNGTVEYIDLPLEMLPVSFSMDSNAVVTMVDEDGNEYTADLKSSIYYIDSVDMYTVGSPSSTQVTYQNLQVNETNFELPGTKYMEQSVILSSSNDTTVVFSSSHIKADSYVDVITTIPDLCYDSVLTVAGSCTIVFAAQASSVEVTVRIYIK